LDPKPVVRESYLQKDGIRFTKEIKNTMHAYTSDNLVVRSGNSSDPDLIVEVTPKLAGWEYIHFQSRRLKKGQSWSFESGECELALVMLGGIVDVSSNRGNWHQIGQRANVFSGLPHALYFPRRTAFTVQAATDCEFAVAWARVDDDREPRLVTPADTLIELRGGDNSSRQINRILPPGFPCSRLVVVEVYTPGGNWSSYPPHKHDVQKVSEGKVNEADLEEIYYYKLDRPEGYAFQRVYTDPESPLHRAGHPIDAALMVRNNDVVLVPEGYHPVACPPGFTAYYLNVLAGSHQSLAASDDPQYAWIKGTYRSFDPRVPLYDISAGKRVD
jgi:5-deoxy-glucuronate isomerase